MTTTQTEPTKEAIAVGAFLSAMHDQGLDGAKVRKAMLDVLGLSATLQAREGEAVAWNHGCNALCTNIDLWVDRCPHCGKPRPAAPVPQPAQPSEPEQPEYFAQYEYALDFSVLVAVYRRRADQTPELIHKEALPKQIGDGQPAQPEQGPST